MRKKVSSYWSRVLQSRLLASYTCAKISRSTTIGSAIFGRQILKNLNTELFSPLPAPSYANNTILTPTRFVNLVSSILVRPSLAELSIDQLKHS